MQNSRVVLYLHPNVDLIQDSATVYVIGEKQFLKIDTPTHGLNQFLDDLTKGIALNELRIRALKLVEISDLLDQLNHLGWLKMYNPATFNGTTYEKQLGYLAEYTNQPSKAQDAINNAKIAILGLGGIGGVVLQQLIGCGFNNFFLIDHDRVALDNLNRQYLYSLDDIGNFKVDAARKYIERASPTTTVHIRKNYIGKAQDMDFLEDYCPDLFILAADKPMHIPEIVDTYTSKRNTPLTMASTGLTSGYWGPTIDYRWHKPFAAFQDKLQNHLTDDEKLLLRREEIITSTYSFGPGNATIASLLANDIVNFFIDKKLVRSWGKRVIFNFNQLTFIEVTYA